MSADAGPAQGAASTGSGDWTEAGAFPVAPGVHRIPLPLPMDGLRAVNVYVIEDDRRPRPHRRVGGRSRSRAPATVDGTGHARLPAP